MSKQPAGRSPQPPVPKNLRKFGRAGRPPVTVHPPTSPNGVPRGEGELCGPTDPVAALPEWMAALLGGAKPGAGFEALRRYLREFTDIGGDPGRDTKGVLTLLLALADNLRASGQALAELPGLAGAITPEQAAFLDQLAQWAAGNRPASQAPRPTGAEQ